MQFYFVVGFIPFFPFWPPVGEWAKHRIVYEMFIKILTMLFRSLLQQICNSMQFQFVKLFFFFRQFEYERRNNQPQWLRNLWKNLFHWLRYCCCILMHHKICILGWSMLTLKYILANVATDLSDPTVFLGIASSKLSTKKLSNAWLELTIARKRYQTWNEKPNARPNLSTR